SLRNEEGLTPYELAIQSSNDWVAHVLRPRAVDEMLLAVAAMDAEAVQKALEAGANPSMNLSDGSTPLHQCARQGRAGFEVAQRLIQAGANPNSMDSNGIPPLTDLLLVDSYPPFIELLLEAGADARLGSMPAFNIAQQSGDQALIDFVSRPTSIPTIPIITRGGFPHPAAQAASACEVYASRNDPGSALKMVSVAVHEKPTNSRYRLYRAKLRAFSGDLEGSMEDYAQLLSDRPSWFDPKVDYGVLLIQNGQFAEGLVLIDEVMARIEQRRDAKLHYNRGMAREALGNLKGALAD
ncbi:MAG: ankyrin repeat domain-containing protein, partial [Planctomycetes bacterium]|nr:ankyrin repeat domain-containing protein [Planctomycetota bacterium]